jgi:hypothetical protein
MRIVKIGRITLGLFLNLLAVWIGVAFFSSVLGRRLWHPHSIQALLRVSYCYDIVVSLLLGFIVYRCFRTETARWIWAIAGAWFLFRVATLLGGTSSLWSHLSGIGCMNGMRNMDCMNWFLFTMLFVRAGAYSFGAWLCSRFFSPAPSSIEGGIIGRFNTHEWAAAGDEGNVKP